jgi:AraC-like DNA-binding protein
MVREASVLTGLPWITVGGREPTVAPRYHWHNRQRTPRGTFVIQRTLHGAAVLRRQQRDHCVPQGKAMIFCYGEPTEYFDDPAAGQPYGDEFIAIRPEGGVAELIGQIRSDFGDVIDMTTDGDAARLQHEIILMLTTGPRPGQVDMAEWIYRWLLAIFREQISGQLNADPIAYLRFILQTQFRSQRTLKEFMAVLPVSREHASRVFMRRYGQSPARYLLHMRLQHARTLLRTTSLTDEKIADASGFIHVNSFRRAFQRCYGSAPRSMQRGSPR